MDIKLLQQFNRDQNVMRLNRIYKSSSILEVVGVERKETRHSKFLKWLFTLPEINTVNQSSPIMHLLDVIVRRDSEQMSVLDKSFGKAILFRDAELEIKDVIIEQQTIGLKVQGKQKQGGQNKLITGQIDIWLKLLNTKTNQNIYIIIENKVESYEHDHQTKKYYAYVTGNTSVFEGCDYEFVANYKCPTNPDDLKIFIYLSPVSEYLMSIKSEIDNLTECKEFIKINYQDIVSDILSPIVDNEETSQATKDKINQYLCALEIPSEKTNSDDVIVNKKVMAATEVTMKLSATVWEKYNPLLIDAILDNSNLYGNFKDNHKVFLSNLLCVLQQTTTDNYLYNLTRFLLLRLEGKTNNFFIKDNGKFDVCNQKVMATKFAQCYYANSLIPKDNPNTAVEELNKVFQTVGGNLFVLRPSIKDIHLCDCIDAKLGIYFSNNKWGPSYMPKLLKFIRASFIQTGFEVIY